MNYINTFIHVSPDTRAQEATAPVAKGGRKSIAVLEYELVFENPYTYTQEQVQFAVHVRRQGVSDQELRARRDELWRAFFSKSRACMRTSPLAKTYGWGLHFNEQGRVALVPVQSVDYERLANNPSVTQTYAVRSKRA